jgi:hypothetical protein
MARTLLGCIQFISYQGKQILLVDFSRCAASEVERIARAVPDCVMTQPRGSVLMLADLTGASFDQEALWTMKATAVFDKPYIRKTAWIGAGSFPPQFYESLKSFSRREFPVFETREEALAWLVAD